MSLEDFSVSTAKAIFDLFNELVKIKNRRSAAPFKKIVVPMHAHFTTVHSLYRQLFWSSVDKLNALAATTDPSGPDFEEWKRDFSSARAAVSKIRWQLREKAEVIYALTTHAPTQRYLASLIHYFLEEKFSAPSDHALDDLIRDVIDRGSLRAYSTPFERATKAVTESVTPSDAKHELLQLIHTLDSRFAEASIRFWKLEYFFAASVPDAVGA